MSAGRWKVYEIAREQIFTGVLDLDTDSFRINLYRSTSNANTLDKATISSMADITNEIATAHGYTQGAKAVTIAVVESGGTVTVSETTNPAWPASGGSITARYAVIYKYVDATPANNTPLCVCLLDTTPADVTAVDGYPLTITQSVSGLFSISGGTVD